jgi:hypothetical protein
MEISGQLHTSATLTLGKEAPVPVKQGLGGPHSCSGHGDKEKKYLLLLGKEPKSSSPYYTKIHWVTSSMSGKSPNGTRD